MKLKNQKTRKQKSNNLFVFLICNKQAGFTLLEFLIYISIVGVVLSITGAIALNIFFGKVKLGALEEVNQNTRFSAETITRHIRMARSVNIPPRGDESALLSLRKDDALVDPTIFSVTDGVIFIQEGANAAVALTSDEVFVTDPKFQDVSYNDTPETVRVEMSIGFKNQSNLQEYIVSRTIKTTANVQE